MTTEKTLSFIVPALNEARNLPAFFSALEGILPQLGVKAEVVLVDDGSTDDTQAVVESWLPRISLHYVGLSRNFGKEAALTAGLSHCRGDVAILIDADLQHPLEKVPEMLAHWRAGAEMVMTVREDRSDESLPKRLFTWAFYRVLNFGTRVEVPANAGDFRLLDRKVVDALLQMPERNRFMKGLYAWVGYRTVVLPYTPAPRFSGTSRFRFFHLLA
ncbi:MAG TPA: glycosyltransferase family 2 protein, partial [Moraxellaceae bacterium]|nr:glycosyltransferase family 2 protein [Moraxellaceae bacterium]